jgi:CRISPR-associated endoribonuclease Cas6
MAGGLSVHIVRIVAEATEPIALDEHPGSALRGALFGALLRRFCTNPTAPTCAQCPLNATCPVAALVAPLRDEAPRGRDVPRPFVLAPSPAFIRQSAPATPQTGGATQRIAPGEPLSFDVSLFGKAAALFPYIALSMPTFELIGLGRKLAECGGRRGRPQVMHIDSIDPFADTAQPLYTRGQSQVHAPALPITPAAVAARAASLPPDRVTFHFLTPTRLVSEGQLVHRPDFRALILRLAERFQALTLEYGESTAADREEDIAIRQLRYFHFERLACDVRLVCDQTRWVDVASYSARQHRATPIGGFVGSATFEGDLKELRELLVWGELLHVGKNAVKGDGLYRIEV